MSERRWLAIALLFGAVAGLAGCVGAPASSPFAPPALSVRADARPGSMLTGPTAAVPHGDAMAVRLEWTWVEGPLPQLAPVSEAARSFVLPTRSEPFAVSAPGAVDLRIALGSEAEDVVEGIDGGRFGRSSAAARLDAAVWKGSAVLFALTAGAPDVFRVAVERGDDGAVRPLVAFPVADTTTPSEVVTVGGPASPLVAFDAPLRASQSLLLVDVGAPGPVLIWRLSVLGPAGPELAQAGRAQLRAAALAPPPPPDVDARARSVLAEALSHSWTRRRALVLLADGHAVPLAADLALLGDDAMVAALAEPVGRAARQNDVDLAWPLTRAAVEVLATRAKGDELAPELRSTAQRHLGETARAPASLLAALARAPGVSAFDAWLRSEHLELLADADPATRVRAHTWLAARDAAPAGYDPLASKAERRAALAALERTP